MPDISTALGYIEAVANIVTPILLLGLGGLGWLLKQNVERRKELEAKLRDDRIAIYNQILEPFVLLLTSENAWTSDPKNKNKNKNEIAMQNMLSIDYRRNAFKLSLMANDSVVKAYNNLMQYFYTMNSTKGSQPSPKEMMRLLGAFLLEIRKSMGNENTSLDEWGMLEWFISDIKSIK